MEQRKQQSQRQRYPRGKRYRCRILVDKQRGWPWVAALGIVAGVEVGTTVASGSVGQGLLAISALVPLLK